MTLGWRAAMRILAGAGRLGALILLVGLLAASVAVPMAEAKKEKPKAAQTVAITPEQDLPNALDNAQSGTTLRLGAGRFNGPIVVRGKSLTIEGQPGGGSVLYTDRADAVVIVTENGEATLKNIAIETRQEKRLAVYVKGAALRLEECNVAKVNDDAVYVEGGTLAMTKCHLSDITGSGVIAAAGASLTIMESTIERVGAVGLSLGQDVKANLAKLSIQAPEALVAVGAAEVLIEDSTLTTTTAEKSGAYIETAGPITLARSTITGTAYGLYFKIRNEASVRIVENLLVGSTRAGVALEQNGPADKGPEIARNRILVAGNDDSALGILLRGAGRASLLENLVSVRKGSGIVLEGGASAAFDGNVVIADGSTVAFVKTDANASRLAREILVPAGALYGSPVLGDTTLSLAAVLRDAAVAEEWKRERDEAISAAESGAPAPLDADRKYFDALVQRSTGMRNLASAQARLSFMLVDAIGREGPGGYALLDENGNEMSRHAASDPPALVAPGRYLLAPDLDPFTTLDATVGPGETKVVLLDRPNALWLQLGLGKDGAPTRHLVTRAPPEQRARAASILHRPWVVDALPDRRLDATSEDAALALTHARAWLQGEAAAKRPANDDKISWNKWHATNRMAYSIMALVGEASDVGWLTEFSKGNEYYWPGNNGILAAALIEARLGILPTGEFASVARSNKGRASLVAALALHRFGIRDYDQVAIDGILQPANATDPQNYGYDFMDAMLDTGDSQVMAVSKHLLQRFSEREAEIAALSKEEREKQYNGYQAARDLAVLHLLAHGAAEEWQLIADAVVPDHLAATAAVFAASPSEIVAIFGAADQTLLLYRLLPHVLAARGEAAADAFALISQQFYEIGYRKAVAQSKASYELPREGEKWVNNFLGYSSAFLPNADAAEFYYFGAERLSVDPLPWIDFEWEREKVVDRFLGGEASNLDMTQIDFIPHDELVRLFATKNAAAALPDMALVLAYHRIGTRAHRVLDITNSGVHVSLPAIERRGFMVRKASTEQAYAGAISARLDLEPSFDGSTLRLKLGLPIAAFYQELCTLAAKIATDCNKAAWLHHPFVVDPRKLIASVALRRGETVIPVTEEEPETAGAYLFSAALDAHAMDNLWVEVRLRFFEQTRDFSIPLFAGTFAKVQRLVAAEIERRKASPDIVAGEAQAMVALGRAQRDYGETDAAWQNFETALSKDSSLNDLWFEGAEMFIAAGRPMRAVEILERAIRAKPDDADLLYAFGVTAYRAKDYAKSATAFGAILAHAPNDAESRRLQASALFLARDWKAAAQAFDALPPDQRPPSLALLRAIASNEAAGGTALDLAAFDAARSRMEEAVSAGAAAESAGGSIIGGLGATGGDQSRACRDDFYGGYRLKLEGRSGDAAAAFERARTSCPPGSIERRAAQLGAL